MDGVFYWILNMSILGSATGALLFCLRFIPRFPKFGLYALWGAAAVRLCIPAAFSSGFSLLGLLKGLGLRCVTLMQAGNVSVTMANSVQAAESYFPVVYKEDSLAPLFAAAAIVWACVAGAMILLAIALYILSARHIKPAPLKDGYCLSGSVDSPAVYGIIRPRILIPAAYAHSPGLKCILAHERVHVKRRDNLWRLIALFIGCAHWFNPLVWVFIKVFFSDMETACDEKALSGCAENERRSYARTLVACASKGGLTSPFSAGPVKSRVMHILTYRKMTLCSACVFAALALAALWVLLTNPA